MSVFLPNGGVLDEQVFLLAFDPSQQLIAYSDGVGLGCHGAEGGIELKAGSQPSEDALAVAGVVVHLVGSVGVLLLFEGRPTPATTPHGVSLPHRTGGDDVDVLV
mgnify:CR=1 FL=1